MLSAVNLHKTYRKFAQQCPVLRGLDLEVHAGEFLSIVGQSGSGKSTLLHLLGTLDQPDEGQIRLDGKRIDDLPAKERDELRNRTFGYIFQFYHLLPELTTLENVLMPQMIRHSTLGWMVRRGCLRRKAEELLERIGLSHRLRHRPRELSGGELQRAAIARAIVNGPRVLLADEPTGNLDTATGDGIVELLRRLSDDEGLTIVLITHDPSIADAAQRVVRMRDGRVLDPEEAVAIR